MTAGDLIPLDSGERARFGWRERPAVRAVVDALLVAAPEGVRFVGGCVRDSLIGEVPSDVDIATTLRPDEVASALAAVGLRSAPTGIEHGTITAIAEGVGVEVTTLRADISTDGRRAVVAFTTDWAVDAARRDFTINALYLTPDARLYDPVGGRADLAARRVRFIGDPAARINEDYLRILRFFRFTARFAEGLDAPGLAACHALADGMSGLSPERVGEELRRLLSLPKPAATVEAMAAAGVLARIHPPAPDIAALERLKSIAPDASPALALAALWRDAVSGLDQGLRLSNAEAARLRAAAANSIEIKARHGAAALRAFRYEAGRAGYEDAMLVAVAKGASDASYREWREIAERQAPPSTFPFSGKDVLGLGLAPGPAVALILKAAERRWIDEDFPDAARAREILVEESRRDASPTSSG